VSAVKVRMSLSPNRNLVFVVDDDPGMLKAVALLLRHNGYSSMLFSSAEAFEEHDDFEKALCVLLDISLNDHRSGVELRRRIAAAGVSVPIIFMTGDDDPAVRKDALESGCLGYLTKPFSARSLIEQLKRAAHHP